MAFSRDWDNTAPIDHLQILSGPLKMRDIRVDVSDRLSAIVSGFVSGETVKGILGLPFIAVTAPAAIAAQIQLYGKTFAGATELTAKDAAGNEIQLTSAGSINGVTLSAVFRSGDCLLSSNAATPTNFTDVSGTYEGQMIRVSATALSTGGSDTHTHAAGSYTVSGNTGGVSFGGGGSLTAGALDTTHTHSVNIAVTGTSASGSNVPVYRTFKLYSRN